MTNADDRPDPLLERISAAYTRAMNGDREWREGTLELAEALAEARARFSDNKSFGRWLNAMPGLDDLGSDDRAALIGMGRNLDIAREILNETTRRSWRLIWLEEIKPIVEPPSSQRCDDDAPEPAAADAPEPAAAADPPADDADADGSTVPTADAPAAAADAPESELARLKAEVAELRRRLDEVLNERFGNCRRQEVSVAKRMRALKLIDRVFSRNAIGSDILITVRAYHRTAPGWLPTEVNNSMFTTQRAA